MANKISTSHRRAFLLIEEIRKCEAELLYIAALPTMGNFSLYKLVCNVLCDIETQMNRLTNELLYPHTGVNHLASYHYDEIYTQIKNIRYKK